MMQVWLVLLGAVLMWQADKWASQSSRFGTDNWAILGMAMLAAGYGCLVISIVLTFVEGGTVG